MDVFFVDGPALETMRTLVNSASDRGMYLRVGVDGNRLKIANGEGMWTLPLAIVESHNV